MSRAPLYSVPPAPAARSISFEALYEAHAEQVFLWASRYAGGRTGWAEDIAHDVFVKAWEHRAWLREEDVKGWLFRVTQNVAFTALRRENTLRGRLWNLLAPSEHGKSAPAPDAELERRQALRTATAALEQLPGQERVVISLKLLDGLSQREIAKLLSLSEGYVSKLIHRAQQRLSSLGWRIDDEQA